MQIPAGELRPTHRGQRQTEVCGLVLHLDFNLVEQSFNLFLLKPIPVSRKSQKKKSGLCSCSADLNLRFLGASYPADYKVLSFCVLDDVIDGLADEELHPLGVLL